MSGHAQLAQTGVPTLVVGGIAYPVGGWMALAAVLLVGLGLVFFRFRFRPNLAAGQAESVETGQVADENGQRDGQ
jgi:murein endopeptidase